MIEHSAAVTVEAPAARVFTLFTHFNDYPKFMRSIKEVTYLDDTRSHWVVDLAGIHEWDAVNEDWVDGRQVGWRSTSGIVNRGRVMFTPDGATRTIVEVTIAYEPPAGMLGRIGDTLGLGATFEAQLREELQHFATMVAAAPPDALDPTSSSYLFHAESAAAGGRTTNAQDQTMSVAPSVDENADASARRQ